MNTYRVKETVDSGYDFVNAEYYHIDTRNYLTFYRRGKNDSEEEVATFDPWMSVVMMDEVADNEQDE